MILTDAQDTQDTQAMAVKKLPPSGGGLRQGTQCPGCGKFLTFHALAYKHKCPRVRGYHTDEARRQRQLESLQARINARIESMPEPPAPIEVA